MGTFPRSLRLRSVKSVSLWGQLRPSRLRLGSYWQPSHVFHGTEGESQATGGAHMEEVMKDGARSGDIEVLGSGYAAGSERHSNMLISHTLLA